MYVFFMGTHIRTAIHDHTKMGECMPH